MQMLIYGAAGTGKQAIADMLARVGFTRIESAPVTSTSDFDQQIEYIQARFLAQIKAQDISHKKDVFTVHGPWDTHFVHSEILLKQERITQTEYDILSKLYKHLSSYMRVPEGVIYTFASPINALNRLALRQIDIHQEAFNEQLKQYALFNTEVRVPKVEVDFDMEFGQIQKDFEFNFSSLKTTGLVAQSLWQREFFHNPNYGSKTTEPSRFAQKE